MANYLSVLDEPKVANLSDLTDDSQIWDSLKQAIASTSGFQRWQLEHQLDIQALGANLENQVNRYLRETLETLAY